jgi:hypothetical protein
VIRHTHTRTRTDAQTDAQRASSRNRGDARTDLCHGRWVTSTATASSAAACRILRNATRQHVCLVTMQGSRRWAFVQHNAVNAVNRWHHRQPHGLATAVTVGVTALDCGWRHVNLSQHKRPKQRVCGFNVGKHTRAVGLQMLHTVAVVVAIGRGRHGGRWHWKAVCSSCL